MILRKFPPSPKWPGTVYQIIASDDGIVLQDSFVVNDHEPRRLTARRLMAARNELRSTLAELKDSND